MQWIQIDSNSTPEGFTRYIQQITPTLFHIIEHDYDYFNGPKMYYGYSTYVDVTDYTEERIFEILQLCGYSERQSPDIEAACHAYQSPELDIYTDTVEDILQWKRQRGLNF